MGDDKARSSRLKFWDFIVEKLPVSPIFRCVFFFFFDKTLGDRWVSAVVTVAEKSRPHGPEWPLKPCGRHM